MYKFVTFVASARIEIWADSLHQARRALVTRLLDYGFSAAKAEELGRQLPLVPASHCGSQYR